jgi:hypothetical protein
MTVSFRRTLLLAVLGLALCVAVPVRAGQDEDCPPAVAGLDLSDQEARELESRVAAAPDDVDARSRLLGYYSSRRFRFGEAREARQGHILWLIRNRPETPVLGTPFANLDAILEPSAYAEGRKAWQEQMERQPKNATILGNAADYLLLHDAATAENLYKRAEAVDPQNPEWPRQLGHLYSLGLSRKKGEERQRSAKVALGAYERAIRLAKRGREEMLSDAAKLALEAGEVAKARGYAEEVLQAAGNDGDRIHQGNLVLGRIALRAGDVEQAKRHLLASAKTKGSPVLSSFGPNMSLAKELLEKGERQAVLDYFALCGIFWKGEELEAWTKKVEAGKVPDFGANLEY